MNRLALSLLRVWKRPLPDVLKTEIMDPIGPSGTWRYHAYANAMVDVDGTPMASVSGDRIGVMYLGKLVEVGSAQDVFDEPLHPYTKALFASIPLPIVDKKRELKILEGNVPSPVNPPSGCRFHTRCPIAQKMCQETEPALRLVRGGREVACHFVD